MIEKSAVLALTAPEYCLIQALRSIPESPVKSRILEIVRELVRIGEDPRCAEAQADGFPCACSSSRCELCKGVFVRLDALSDSFLPPPAA